MKRILLFVSAIPFCLVLLSSMRNKKTISDAAIVTISSTSLDKTSVNGVTLKYIVRGFEAKSLSGIDHGSCLNTTTKPEIGKAGSIQSKGVGGTVDPRGKAAAAGTFYCAAYTKNMQKGVKYYVRPYIKLSDGSILYGNEKYITMN